MIDSKASQPETTEDEKPKLPWELTADCTRFIIQWSEQLHRVKVESIFDVFRKELLRREGLRVYGVRMKGRPRLVASQQDHASGSVLTGEKAQTLQAFTPKLLSKSEAA